MAKAQRADTPTTIEPRKEVHNLPMQYEVKINSIRPEGTILATASVNLNGCFAIRGVKVMQSERGPFVSMPRYRAGEKYRDICFPCTKEAHTEFTYAVLNAYEQALGQSQARTQGSAAPRVPAHEDGPAMTM